MSEPKKKKEPAVDPKTGIEGSDDRLGKAIVVRGEGTELFHRETGMVIKITKKPDFVK